MDWSTENLSSIDVDWIDDVLAYINGSTTETVSIESPSTTVINHNTVHNAADYDGSFASNNGTNYWQNVFGQNAVVTTLEPFQFKEVPVTNYGKGDQLATTNTNSTTTTTTTFADDAAAATTITTSNPTSNDAAITISNINTGNAQPSTFTRPSTKSDRIYGQEFLEPTILKCEPQRTIIKIDEQNHEEILQPDGSVGNNISYGKNQTVDNSTTPSTTTSTAANNNNDTKISSIGENRIIPTPTERSYIELDLVHEQIPTLCDRCFAITCICHLFHDYHLGS